MSSVAELEASMAESRHQLGAVMAGLEQVRQAAGGLKVFRNQTLLFWII